MTGARALVGADVFDGVHLLGQHAVVLDGVGPRIVPKCDLPADTRQISLAGGTLMPGFVDLQVNGGGGVMLNAAPTMQTIRVMADAHLRLGTTCFLPTLITDTPEVTAAAIAAVVQAIDAGVRGVAGLHLEGPHLSVAKKGAHDAKLIRPMGPSDVRLLLDATEKLPNLMVTVAAETVATDTIKTLADAGIIVSIGHSDADYDTAMRAFDAGARCATHLFNAMSPLGSRAPGVVGAALAHPNACAGLIADGVHVHPATIRAALAATAGQSDIFLVTDAMACAGSEITEFQLNGRTVTRADGRLTLGDGTLAGADVSMGQALRVLIEEVKEPPARAFARATSIPASVLRKANGAGAWPERYDRLVYLGEDFSVRHASALI